MSKVDLRLQCGMPCSKLEVSTVQHGTLSGAGYLHQSPGCYCVRVTDYVGRVISMEIDQDLGEHSKRSPSSPDKLSAES